MTRLSCPSALSSVPSVIFSIDQTKYLYFTLTFSTKSQKTRQRRTNSCPALWDRQRRDALRAGASHNIYCYHLVTLDTHWPYSSLSWSIFLFSSRKAVSCLSQTWHTLTGRKDEGCCEGLGPPTSTLTGKACKRECMCIQQRQEPN